MENRQCLFSSNNHIQWTNHIDPFKNAMQQVQLLSLPSPSEPFHVRGRFERVAGCMGKKGRGLVKKRQQATEMHDPTKVG